MTAVGTMNDGIAKASTTVPLQRWCFQKNMISNFMLALPHLPQGHLLASIVGIASYFCLFFIKQPRITSLLAVVAVLVVTVLTYQMFVTSAFIYTLLAFLVFPTIGAGVQGRLVPYSRGWIDGYLSLLVSTFLSLLGAYGIFRFGYHSWILPTDLTGMAMFIGSVVMPSIVAIFCWLFKSSQLRPGTDRQFYPEENRG